MSGGLFEEQAAQRGERGLATRLASAPGHGPADARTGLREPAMDLEAGVVVLLGGHEEVPDQAMVPAFAQVEGGASRADQAIDSGLVEGLGVLHSQ